MPHQGESKMCKMCCEEIAAAAKKCPYCHHWQYWASLITFHPLFSLVFLIPMMILFIAFMVWFQNALFYKGEPFRDHADQITVIKSTMEFGQDQSGPTVAVVGVLKNPSPIDWKDVRLQAEFFDAKGTLIDASQQDEYRSPRLPANQEVGFKVSLTRQFPESKYSRYKVRAISAIDSRQRF